MTVTTPPRLNVPSDEHLLAKEVLGEQAVYPTPPAWVAYCIVNRFDSLAAAAQRPVDDDRPWCDAQTDSCIPGAGDMVSTAVRRLLALREGKSPEQVVDALLTAWTDAKAGGHFNAIEQGEAQGRRIAPLLTAKLHEWPVE